MTPMPASLLTIEGEAWLLLGQAEMATFEARHGPDYFAAVRAVRDDYAKLSPAKFIEKYS